MSTLAPPVLLLISAFLHAAWNTTAKVSKDKNTFVFLTIFFACVLVLIALLLEEKVFMVGGPRGLKYSILAGVFEGGYLISVAKGLSRASLAKTYSVMRGAGMVLVWVVSLCLSMETFNPVSLVSSLIVLAGIAVTGLSRQRGQSPGVGCSRSGEMIWPLVGAIFIAGYHICYGKSLSFGAEPKALFLTALATALPIIFLSAPGDFIGRSKFVLTEEKLKLLISSVGASVGFIIFLHGLRASGPGYAITLRNSSIFFSIGFSLVIGDKLTKTQVVGALIVGMGAMVLSLG